MTFPLTDHCFTIIMGSPGSGKTTLATQLAKTYNGKAMVISCGDLYREHGRETRYKFLEEAKLNGKGAWIEALKRFIVEALQQRILKHKNIKTFIIEGLWEDNLRVFQRKIGPINKLYYINIKASIAKDRLFNRGRRDDYEKKINQRVDSYFQREDSMIATIEKLNVPIEWLSA